MAKIIGFEEFAAELEDFEEALWASASRLDTAVDVATRDTAMQIEKDAKRFAPVDTGALRADLQYTRLGEAEYSVGSTKKYAPPTEYGSAPHIITPSDAEALRFTATRSVFGIGDETLFREWVQHPGTPAQPFLRPALSINRGELAENIADEIQRVIDAHL